MCVVLAGEDWEGWLILNCMGENWPTLLALPELEYPVLFGSPEWMIPVLPGGPENVRRRGENGNKNTQLV